MKKAPTVVVLMVIAAVAVLAVVLTRTSIGGSMLALQGLPASPPHVSPILQPMRDYFWQFHSESCWQFNHWIRVTVMGAIRQMQAQLDQYVAANPGTPPDAAQAARVAARLLHPALIKGRRELARCGPHATMYGPRLMQWRPMTHPWITQYMNISFEELEDMLVTMAT